VDPMAFTHVDRDCGAAASVHLQHYIKIRCELFALRRQFGCDTPAAPQSSAARVTDWRSARCGGAADLERMRC
jgi:hypothetical protein